MYVYPKDDCPHVMDPSRIIKFEEYEKIDFLSKKCKNCDEIFENWVCLICGDLFCSRYINSHFISHNLEKTDHNICLSLMDLSFWCYSCESYIINKELNKYYKVLSDLKFGKNFLVGLENISQAMDKLQIDTKKASEIKYTNFIELLKLGKFKKISFLTGAGISTTAGIPDFRSCESGIFKTLQEKYKLSTPEEFFDIETFRRKPELFYEFSRDFDLDKYKATSTHWFMSFLNHKGLLNLIYTQNIDSLEFKAKIPKEKIVFAHGNLLESHCSKCYIECDFEKQQNHIKEGKILYCQSCNSPCKPKVVFYGEGLPKEFFNRQNELIDSDLCFIMGSSLKVYPFAYLPFTINKHAWRMVINRERVGEENTWNSFQYDSLGSQDAFIEGSTDDIVIKILKDAGWKDEFDSFINSFSI